MKVNIIKYGILILLLLACFWPLLTYMDHWDFEHSWRIKLMVAFDKKTPSGTSVESAKDMMWNVKNVNWWLNNVLLFLGLTRYGICLNFYRRTEVPHSDRKSSDGCEKHLLGEEDPPDSEPRVMRKQRSNSRLDFCFNIWHSSENLVKRWSRSNFGRTKIKCLIRTSVRDYLSSQSVPILKMQNERYFFQFVKPIVW